MSTDSITTLAAIAAGFSAFFALLTVILNFISHLNSKEEKYLSVQPWFYLNSHSRLGLEVDLKWKIINVGNMNYKVRKVYLSFYNVNRVVEINYTYDFKDLDKNALNLTIPYEEVKPYNAQPFQIVIEYTNLYNKSMKATSDVIRFKKYESEIIVLDIDEGFSIPFFNVTI